MLISHHYSCTTADDAPSLFLILTNIFLFFALIKNALRKSNKIATPRNTSKQQANMQKSKEVESSEEKMSSNSSSNNNTTIYNSLIY
jgi:hypothetical protein